MRIVKHYINTSSLGTAPRVPAEMSSSWRSAGITYLQYLEMSASAVRSCLKQPLRDQVQARAAVHFRHRSYQNGRLLRSRACTARRGAREPRGGLLVAACVEMRRRCALPPPRGRGGARERGAEPRPGARARGPACSLAAPPRFLRNRAVGSLCSLRGGALLTLHSPPGARLRLRRDVREQPREHQEGGRMRSGPRDAGPRRPAGVPTRRAAAFGGAAPP